MIQDMAISDSALFASDTETDQSRLWLTPTHEISMRDVWNEDDYIRLPTFERAGEPKFNLTETAQKIFLHPGKVPK